MTQIYDESGKVIPVTVLKAGPCRVILKRTLEKDGYQAIQVGFEEKKPSRVNQPEQGGHFKKAKVPPVPGVKGIQNG